MMVEMLMTACFVAVMVVAAVTDARTSRIPNKLVLAGLVAAVVLRAAGGLDLLLGGLAGAALGLALTFPLFALGAIGAGDAKLLAVVGAFMGPRTFVVALLASAVVGGILGLVMAVRSGLLIPLLVRTKDLAVNAATMGARGSRPSLSDAGAVAVPYGVAIAIGSVAVWFV
jgi:prepilin peptidase CpaA